MQFEHPWRPYQARVLEAIEAHLSDRRLHVVAAPGSGKTILGLETFRRLGRPAVILTPTTTIRDQWLRRLEHFLPGESAIPPGWASRDLSEPGFLTSVTYQALHTKYRESGEDPGEESPEGADGSPTRRELKEVVHRFKRLGLGTLILDEAHHLRQEWWKALSRLADELDGLTVVSLTATPPYDVVGSEWTRYEELCGPIDEEISVPELVKSGTLCAHQDYVWAVRPPAEDRQTVREYDDAVERLTGELLADDVLLAAVAGHPWLSSREPDAADVLDEPEFAFAMLIYLKARGERLPKPLMKLLDTRPGDLPGLNRRWWQVLVQHYVYGETWPDGEAREQHRDALAKRLRSDGLLYRRELRIQESSPVKTALGMSGAKIDACVDIHRLERELRGDGLRQVVLTDFIRDDDLENARPEGRRRLGAWPVFRALALAARREEAPGIALLTGRLVVVHQDRVEDLRAALGPEAEALSVEPLGAVLEYVRVRAAGSVRLVGPLTELLIQGKIQVLVGTRSLLGEGWDAPVVNSLVLASYVGSFMLSNQMRGRAIRKDPQQPDKASSIWHIVAVEPGTDSGDSDLEDLGRRFRMFVGLAAERDVVESGLGRLGLPEPERREELDAFNERSAGRLRRHGELAERWQQAILSAEEGRVLPSVSTEKPPTVRPFLFRNTLAHLLHAALYSFLGGAAWVAQGMPENADWKVGLLVLAAAAVVGLLFALPKLLRSLWLLAWNLPVDGSVRQIALALRDALSRADLVQTHPRRLSVQVTRTDDGAYSIALRGGTFYEHALFADCLQEMLNPIENPRYLITRRGTGLLGRRLDYHAVPQPLGVNKERATLLHAAWERRLGAGELVYTRNTEGRPLLLKARARAFSRAFAARAERCDRWQ